MNKLIIALLAIAAIGNSFLVEACVTVDLSGGTYTVDQSGSVEGIRN